MPRRLIPIVPVGPLPDDSVPEEIKIKKGGTYFPPPDVVADRFAKMRAGAGRWAKERALAAQRGDPTPVGRIRARHWEIIMRHLAGYPNRMIAEQLGYTSMVPVKRYLNTPEAKGIIEQVRTAQLERVINGQFGPIAMAKAVATKMMTKEIHLAEHAQSEKVQFQAADRVLAHAGYVPSEKIEVHHLHELLGRFTTEELEVYAKTGEPPERFRGVFTALEDQRDRSALDVTPKEDG